MEIYRADRGDSLRLFWILALIVLTVINLAVLYADYKVAENMRVYIQDQESKTKKIIIEFQETKGMQFQDLE